MDKKKLRDNAHRLGHKLALEGLSNHNLEALAFAAVINAVELSIRLGDGRMESLMDVVSKWIVFEMTGVEIKDDEDFDKLLVQMQQYLAMAGNSPHGES